MVQEPISPDGSANRTRVGGRSEGTGMDVTTTGLVRASAVLFAVAAALFAAGLVVADRATAGAGDVGVSEIGATSPAPVVPTGAPTGPPAQDLTSSPAPVVVRTRVVTVTVPPVTTTVAASPTATDPPTTEPATSSSPSTSPSTPPSTSAPAEPTVTPSAAGRHRAALIHRRVRPG